MDAAFFVLAIMGCADGAAGCAEARVEPAHYATMQQCQAAMPAVLVRNADLSYPVISATCRRNTLQMADRGSRPRG